MSELLINSVHIIKLGSLAIIINFLGIKRRTLLDGIACNTNNYFKSPQLTTVNRRQTVMYFSKTITC